MNASEFYDMYLKTYSDCDSNNLWHAIFTACELFRSLAIQVSDQLGYVYNIKDEENMIAYLKAVKSNSLCTQ